MKKESTRKLAAILFADMTEWFCPDLWYGAPIFSRGEARTNRNLAKAKSEVQWTLGAVSPKGKGSQDGKSIFDNEGTVSPCSQLQQNTNFITNLIGF
jgi:hypothetical protein